MTYEVLVTDDASRDLADICEIIVLLRRSTLDARNHWLSYPARGLQFTLAYPAILSRFDHLADYLDSQVKFPPFLGGPFRYADSLGIAALVEKLQQDRQRLGERFAPAEALTQMAKERRSFYTD